MLIFGSGEPVSRLRRALDLKGKVNLGIDETIVPVLNIFNATEPPFRRTGVRWYQNINVPGVAGELGRVRIFHQLPIDQLIDTFHFIVETAAISPRFIVGAGPSGAAGGSNVRTTEIVRVDSGGVPSRALPILTLADTVTPTSLSQEFFEVVSQADETHIVKNDLVLPAQPDRADPITNAPTITIEGDVAGLAFRVSLSGLYWDSLPLNDRT